MATQTQVKTGSKQSPDLEQKVQKLRPRPIARIDLRKRTKQTTVVRITITTKSGKKLTGKRVYHPCTKKLPDRGFKY